jgi:import receptor subunit TOM20
VKKIAPLPAALQERASLPEPAAGSPEYTFYDHVERLRYMAVNQTEMILLEHNLLADVLKKAVEGLEELVELEKYLVMKGRIAYNAIGVAFGEGRDDRVSVYT